MHFFICILEDFKEEDIFLANKPKKSKNVYALLQIKPYNFTVCIVGVICQHFTDRTHTHTNINEHFPCRCDAHLTSRYRDFIRNRQSVMNYILFISE